MARKIKKEQVIKIQKIDGLKGESYIDNGILYPIVDGTTSVPVIEDAENGTDSSLGGDLE